MHVTLLHSCHMHFICCFTSINMYIILLTRASYLTTIWCLHIWTLAFNTTFIILTFLLSCACMSTAGRTKLLYRINERITTSVNRSCRFWETWSLMLIGSSANIKPIKTCSHVLIQTTISAVHKVTLGINWFATFHPGHAHNRRAFFSFRYLLVHSWDCGISVLEHWIPLACPLKPH